MPVYDYECPKCHAEMELSRSVADRDEPLMCDCGGVMRRKVSKLAAFWFVAGKRSEGTRDNDQ